MLRWLTLIAALVFFAITLALPAHYNYAAGGFQFQMIHAWTSSRYIYYHAGVDGISLWLVVAIGLLAPIAVLASWNKEVGRHPKAFCSIFLLQQGVMAGVFVSLDLFLFYAFWLLSLILPAILIAVAGRRRRGSTVLKFSLFTVLPSLLLLASIFWLYLHLGTSDFVQIRNMLIARAPNISSAALLWVSLGFLTAFSIKAPVFPAHGWLASFFENAPVAISMTAAGMLGIYSILRFNVGLFPAQAREAAPWMIVLAVLGALYGATLAISERNIWRIAGYATLSCVSLSVLGIFCFTVNGMDGAIYQVLNQAVIGGALLILAGFLRERYDSDRLDAYGGLAAHMPRLALLFVVTSLAWIGLPLLSGFVAQFLILSGAFPLHTGWTTAAALVFVLSACYMLRLIRHIFLGQQSEMITSTAPHRLVFREHLIAWPMILIMLAMGIISPYWMRSIDPAAVSLVSSVPSSYPAAHPQNQVLRPQTRTLPGRPTRETAPRTMR